MKKVIALASMLALTPATLQAENLDAEQQKQVRELVEKTLMDNPEIIVNVINKLRAKEMQARQKAEEGTLSGMSDKLFNNPKDPFLGNPKGSVTLVYFGDVNCGFCKRQEQVLEQLVKDIPELKVVYKHLPVLGPASTEAAELVLAYLDSTTMKAYFKVHDRLMSKSGRHTSESIKESFKAEGIDSDSLKVTEKVKQQLAENRAIAEALNIRGTPALMFEDEVLRGYTDADRLKSIVAERLEEE